MTTALRSLAAAAAAVVATTMLAGPAFAEDAYNASVAGNRNGQPLVNLAQSSTQTVDVVNLPANVGLYVLHCKVPADPRSAPTVCDESAGAFGYLTATPEARAAVSIPVRVSAEFYGTDPSPTGASTGESVDCRMDTGNPRLTTCALYVLGAGRDAANPTYMRVFPTTFLPVNAQRANDRATLTLDGVVVKRGAKPKLPVNVVVPFTVTLKSGLTPSVSADNCTITTDDSGAPVSITALKDRGTCVVRITSTGGRSFKPLVQTQVFRLTK